MEITEWDDGVRIRSTSVDFTFNAALGAITSYKVNGTEYFDGGFGIRPNFWRAPNDNDYGNGAPLRLQVWKTISNRPVVERFSVVRKGDGVRLTAEYGWETAEAGLKHVAYRVDYTLYPDGELHAALHYAPSVTTETYDTDKLNAGTHDGAAATFTPKTEAVPDSCGIRPYLLFRTRPRGELCRPLPRNCRGTLLGKGVGDVYPLSAPAGERPSYANALDDRNG